LATPRTDITQAVGRILRVKHERPLVIDIIDSHPVFQQQWLKRKKFYVSNKYKIQHTNSQRYAANKWTTLYDPNDTSCKKKQMTLEEENSSSGELRKGKCLLKF
jgi:superfamily II DNA or RNA helicase